MLSIVSSENSNLPENCNFRWTAHHVKEIFLALLPKKFTLDTMSKFSISFGPKGNDPKYQQMIGCSNYYVEDFDFEIFFNLTKSEQEEIILNKLEGALLNIGKKKFNADLDIIKSTISKVRESNFRMKILIKKLSRTSPSRKIKLNIYRILSKEDCESWLLEIINNKGKLLHNEWIGKHPGHLVRTDQFRTSEWNGNNFLIRDRFKDEVFKINISKFKNKCEAATLK